MKKKILLLMTMILLVICTACGKDKSSQETAPKVQMEEVDSEEVDQADETTQTEAVERMDEGTQTEDVDQADAQYPMTLVDQAGRELVLEKQPESLVSVYYITTSALLALDLKNEIKGVESNLEKRPLYQFCDPALLDVTQVGSPKELDLEACAKVNPDLIILPMRAKDMVEPLEQLGINVMVVNPESQEDIFQMLQLIGKATGKEDRAQELIAYIQDKLALLEEKTKSADALPVYLGGNSSFFSTASKGMYQNELIAMAGGKNVAGDIDDTYWVEVSYEQILEWNPEVIIMASDASYTMDEIQNDENLAFCDAVTNKKIYKIPSEIEAWDSPVPSSFLGAIYVSSVLHPDLITAGQYEEIVEEFYERFYGFSYAEK